MSSFRTLAVACVLLLSSAASAAAQQTIFIVRHAERADAGAGAAGMVAPAADPPLSAAGRERAARLAAMLRSAAIKHIFTTEFRRTQETAAPLAEQLKLTPFVSGSKDPTPLVSRLRQVNGNVLIVGHSNTVPELLKGLGIKDEITIPDTEYDNLFIVVRPVTGEATLIRLRY